MFQQEETIIVWREVVMITLWLLASLVFPLREPRAILQATSKELVKICIIFIDKINGYLTKKAKNKDMGSVASRWLLQ